MGRWNRDTQCRPVCYWRQFDEWEHRMMGLWSLVQAAEAFTDEMKDKRIRFWVDADLFRECREGQHPAFGSPYFEPWEVLATMREVASWMNDDRAAQQQMLTGWRR